MSQLLSDPCARLGIPRHQQEFKFWEDLGQKGVIFIEWYYFFKVKVVISQRFVWVV